MPSGFPSPSPAPWSQIEAEDMQESSSRRNILKWEPDEDMGHLSTISPVLYANMRHPELRQQYPGMDPGFQCNLQLFDLLIFVGELFDLNSRGLLTIHFSV